MFDWFHKTLPKNTFYALLEMSLHLEKTHSNANSLTSGGCHSHPKVATRLSKKLPFHQHFYLTNKQQHNITTNTPQSSNQID